MESKTYWYVTYLFVLSGGGTGSSAGAIELINKSWFPIREVTNMIIEGTRTTSVPAKYVMITDWKDITEQQYQEWQGE